MVDEFVAFVDEAGALHLNESVHEYCFVSGFMADREIWNQFDVDWSARLHNGVPFTAKDFFDRTPKGERAATYRGWGDEEDARYIGQLISVIHAWPIIKLGSAVEVDAFRRYSVGERKWLTGARFQDDQFQTPGSPDRPYFVAFSRVIWTAMEATPPGARVSFVFCRSADRVKWSEDFYADLTALLDSSPFENRLGSIDFSLAKDAPGLQAADLRAHLWNQIFQRAERTSQNRKDAAIALEGDTRLHGVYDAEHLERAFSDMPDEMRAALRAYREG